MTVSGPAAGVQLDRGLPPTMTVRRRSAPVGDIVSTFNRERTWFGSGPFGGLVAPSTVVLSTEAQVEVLRSLEAVWEWQRSWQAIYGDLITVEPDHPLVRLCEWGLSSDQLRVQRRSALAGSLPALVRLDSVTAVPTVQIAEAQWKGGGEGFLAGVDAAYRSFFPLDSDEQPTSTLDEMWADYYVSLAGGGCAVSVVRADWCDADRALADRLVRARGIDVIVATPEELAARLFVRSGRVLYRTDTGEAAVALLRCDRLGDALTGRALDEVVACSDAGSVVLDPPPTYLCVQKFGMALPFDARFAGYFSDAVRRFLIPTVLIADPPDCRPLVASLGEQGEALATLTSWDEVPRLPRALRNRLVVKCGSANSMWNQGGRGVWKLGGSTRAVERVWGMVLARARTGREAWVLQPYIDQTWPVDLYHPEHPKVAHAIDAHVRLLFYGRRQDESVSFVGGGANFGAFWKVSGKSARWSSTERLEGSAFCDLRMQSSQVVI